MAIYKESDSIEAKFRLAAKVRAAGGTLTRARIATTCRALEEVARAGRWGKVSPENLTEKQFVKFMEARKNHVTADGKRLSANSLRNESAHIRRALRGVGRDDFAAAVTNEVLGLPHGSRIGTGTATHPEVLAAARERVEDNVRALIDLCDGAGLRIREALSCAKSLETWKIEMKNSQPLTVEYGTKGGKGRTVFLRTEESRDLVRDAIGRALAFIKHEREGFLIPSVSLEGAFKSAERSLAAAGLEGENSAHSLRRNFAVREYIEMRENGFTKKQACEKLSMGLGHGSSRYRWVWNNYLKATLEAMSYE